MNSAPSQRETDIFEMTAHYQREADERLCERLEHQTVVAEHETPACALILPNGETLECGPSVSQTVMMRNPDGPEAARRIRELWAELERKG